VAAHFTALDVHDVRFSTSDNLDGSDAMNPNPDYSAAYAILRTDAADGLEAHALAFSSCPVDLAAGGVGFAGIERRCWGSDRDSHL